VNQTDALPYVQLDNVYVVPVFPERLSGALMVRRAVQDLAIGPKDAVAVARPECVKKRFLKAVSNLPRSTLIHAFNSEAPAAGSDSVSKVGDGDEKELVTVTPADGLTEAVLSATEIGIDPQFIDLDLSPHLQAPRPPCGEGTLGLDDWLGPVLGARAFVDLFHDHPRVRDRRIVPVDDWRERHMAAQLQQIHLRYDRLLFVCYLENVVGIELALHQPLTLVDSPSSRFDVTSIEPKASLLLQFLDDYPKVVEQYWSFRNSPGAVCGFDKMALVQEEIIECATNSNLWSWSLRHHRAFQQMLRGVMRETGRCSVPLAECLALVQACYNRHFAEQVRSRLLTFEAANISSETAQRSFLKAGGESAVDRVSGPQQVQSLMPFSRPTGDTGVSEGSDLADTAGNQPGKPRATRDQVYVRACNHAQQFELIDESNEDFNPRLTWPAVISHHNEMRNRVLRLAANTDLTTTSERYRGSLEYGLDLRRVLRAAYKGDPSLYVRRKRNGRTTFGTPRGVRPVLWFFSSTEDAWDTETQITTWNSHEGDSWDKRYALATEWGTERLIATHDRIESRLRIHVQSVKFMVSFAELGLTPSEIEERYGESVANIPTDYLVRDFPKTLQRIVDSATSHVYCVIPSTDRVPGVLGNYVSSTGKAMVVLTHSDVGRSDIEKLSRWIDVDNGGKAKNKKNTMEAVSRYQEMVDRFWW